MKLLIAIAFFVCVSGEVRAQEARIPVIVNPDKFDEWGDVSFNDEKIHLDKIASKAKEWSLSIVHLVVHAGQTACAGEAKARGIRARNYLVSRGIPVQRVVWIDAGWRKDFLVEVWIWPPELGAPKLNSDLNLERSQVTLLKNCKQKPRVR